MLENPRIFSDVTSVVVIPTACGVFLQSSLGSEAGMLSMWLRIFRRENRIHTETIPRQEEASLWPHWQMGRKNDHREGTVSPGQGSGSFPEEVDLSWSFQEYRL